MRITNQMMQRDASLRMQGNLRQVNTALQQATTGLRLQRASDDPAAASSAMQARGSLRALDQYRRNVQNATSRLTQVESTLDQLTGTLTRAKELGLAQGGDTANAATRKIAAAEARQLLAHAVALGNTQFQGEYLFGGLNTDPAGAAPFVAAPTFLPADPTNPDFTANADPTGKRQAEIATGQVFRGTADGKEVFLNSGALKALYDLAEGLDQDDAPRIRTALGALGSAFDHTQALLGEAGASMNQLQVTSTNLDALEINLQTFKSDLEDADFEKAVTELVSRQTAYQAAMMATSRVIGMTLTDYLR